MFKEYTCTDIYTDKLHKNHNEIAAGCNFGATKIALSCIELLRQKIACVNGPFVSLSFFGIVFSGGRGGGPLPVPPSLDSLPRSW